MLKELRRCLKAEKKDRSIFDIVLYGSAVKGKYSPGDIDIAVIFREGALKDRLDKIQLIKRKIKTEKKIDIKGFLFEELFQENFFGRSGIFLEGISIFDGKRLAGKIGFESRAIFIYNLRKKSHTEKVKFNYVLAGRNAKGIVKMLEGKHLAPGVVEMPIKNSLEFEEVLKKHNIDYSKKNVLIQSF
ncbi:nucleotidyltransferase domain-containing protein [Candidatus Woesearchaeota archaeon]|nr:nucleotidyltransferase domain-containing protein [Candidatus Woesearchaeota archaeon]